MFQPKLEQNGVAKISFDRQDIMLLSTRVRRERARDSVSKMEVTALRNLMVVLQEGDLFQAPENELSEKTHVLTKQNTLWGRGTQEGSSKVREPRRTAQPHRQWVFS